MSDNRQQKKGRWTGFDIGGGSPSDGPRRVRFSLWWIVLLVLALILIPSLFRGGAEDIQYSDLLNLIERGQVEFVAIGETFVEADLASGEMVTATRPPGDDGGALEQLLRQNDVEFSGVPVNGFLQFIYTLLPTFLIIGLLYFFLFRRMSGGAAAALNLGRNKVRIYDRKEMKTTFDDVAGLDEPVQELREIVDFLMNPKKYQRLGGRIPKGVLLLGPPGCGKTLLARAVAGEANVPFFFMSGSEFVEMFVGLGAARVRELFNQAKEKAPALVFLDELDTIGKGRMGGYGGGLGSHDEREQTLNQLLVEMDGFDSSKGVIIMAATNRPDVLDPALVRPGRFDRQVVVDRPDLRGREAILKVHARGVALDPGVDLKIIASRTPGFTGADLANVVNEAALLAARREKDSVTETELEEAIDRVVAGLERKSRVMSDKEREIVAVHEMGHALVALAMPTADPVHRVSIIPRGAAALGMTMQRPLEDRYLLTEPELGDRLAILLGGRTAEELTFGQVSTGAQNDLERATEIARAMVTEYGMSEKIGPLSFGHNGFRGREGMVLFPGERTEMSDATARVVDEEVTRLVNEAHNRAQQVLAERQELMGRLSRLLMAREVIEGENLRTYVAGTAPIPDPSDVPPEGVPTQELTPSGPEIISSPDQ
jgi:cell division protease FtsH